MLVSPQNHSFPPPMGTLQLGSYPISSSSPAIFKFRRRFSSSFLSLKHDEPLSFNRGRVIAASETPSEAIEPEEPPLVDFAFVSSVLLPDGTPDVHLRRQCGGQKLRRVMLNSNIELYGPYARPLLNCAGGGTCGTCMVEIIQGKELLNPRTDKEKEKLHRKPKNWRLACQTTVGKPDSRGLLVVQQLPEWKAHEWKYEKVRISEDEEKS